MKKVLTAVITAAMMLAMALALSACSEEPCKGDEVGKGANQLSRKEPTCTSQGYIEYECSKGGANHVVILDALGHDNIKWFDDVIATCTSDGSKHSECTVCGEQVDTKIVPATGHTESAWKIDKAATCLDNGSKHTECKECGEVISQQVIVATGHDMDPTWKTIKRVTCLEDGEKYQKCKNCDYKIYETIKAEGHQYGDEYEIITYPTCKTEGCEELRCDVCNELIDRRAIAITDHNRIEVLTVEPTCTTNGIKQIVCGYADCGEVFGTETAFAIGHELETIVDVEPDCLNPGWEHKACIRCDLEYDGQEVPATGHDIVDGVCINFGCDIYERVVNVVYKSPTHNTLPESYSFVVYSNEEIVIDKIPEISGHFSVVEIENDEEGINVTYNVTYLKNSVKLVTSVEKIVINVPYNTKFADIGLPVDIIGYTADGEQVNLKAEWHGNGGIYDPTYNKSTQILTGKVYIAKEMANLCYTLVHEITAEVTVGPNIVSVNDSIIGEVVYNTPFEDLTLPDTVVAIDNTGAISELKVIWSADGYDASKAGLQTITGTVISADGKKINYVTAAALVVVVKNIVSVEDVDFGLIIYGTKFNAAGIPNTVTCYAEDGTKVELAVTWNTSAYNPNQLGKQTVTGKISGVDGYKVSDVNVNLHIDIKKAIEEIVVAPAGYINLGYVNVGTSFADVPNLHTMYSVVQVKLNDGTTRNVRIIWDSSSYNPNAQGSNTIIGHFELTEDLWIEDTTVIARYEGI